VIALSIKIFGHTTFAVRLPSLLLTTSLIPIIYKIGKNTLNANIGFFATLIYATSFYNVNFISGQTFTDHNDVFFMCLITYGIWAYTEYRVSKKRKWIIIIGLFCGMAVMVKWLVGLMLYIAWFTHILIEKNNRKRLLSYFDLVISCVVSFIVFLPWQIYAFSRFPGEYSYEYLGMINHFFNVVEGHGGGMSYHIFRMLDIYGWPFLIIGFLSFVLIVIKKRIRDFSFFIVYALFVFSFFTVAATKMPSFTLIACSAFYIISAYLYDFFLAYIRKVQLFGTVFKHVLIISSLVIICFLNLRPISLFSYHSITTKNDYLKEYRLMKLYNTDVFKQINSETPNNIVIFNCIYPNNIEIMFYGDHMAYPFIPTEIQIQDLKEKNYKIGVINRNLPDYIKSDPDIVLIDKFILDQPK
jgi:4-amino-4-deoxy-L-arabinose transferase